MRRHLWPMSRFTPVLLALLIAVPAPPPAAVPVIAPYADSRAQVRARHVERLVAFAEVYVATPVEICSARDVKGLYAKQRAGILSGLTGVDDPYEAPRSPELVVPAHTQSVVESVDAVHAFVLSTLSPSAQHKRERP